MAGQGEALLKLGPNAVLMKGGHLEGDDAIDLLVAENTVSRFAAPKLASKNLHGTGCTLSSAIAANFVLGLPLLEAVAAAKSFVRQASRLSKTSHLAGEPGFDPTGCVRNSDARPYSR
jgi:hydroxymethylpyrimidine/phosphomethylpyrimidine kinase